MHVSPQLFFFFFGKGTERIYKKLNSKKRSISVQLDVHSALFHGYWQSQWVLCARIYLLACPYTFQSKSSILKTSLLFGSVTSLMLEQAALPSGEAWSQVLQGSMRAEGKRTSSGSPVLSIRPKREDQEVLTPSLACVSLGREGVTCWPLHWRVALGS